MTIEQVTLQPMGDIRITITVSRTDFVMQPSCRVNRLAEILKALQEECRYLQYGPEDVPKRPEPQPDEWV